MAKSREEVGCSSFFSLLGLLFIGLKLCDVIDWAWWLVLLPIYGPAVLIFLVFVGAGLIGVTAAVAQAVAERGLDKRRGL